MSDREKLLADIERVLARVRDPSRFVQLMEGGAEEQLDQWMLANILNRCTAMLLADASNAALPESKLT